MNRTMRDLDMWEKEVWRDLLPRLDLPSLTVLDDRMKSPVIQMTPMFEGWIKKHHLTGVVKHGDFGLFARDTCRNPCMPTMETCNVMDAICQTMEGMHWGIDLAKGKDKTGYTCLGLAVRFLDDELFPQVWTQFRFPRSRKKRIRDKWSKNKHNWRFEDRLFITRGELFIPERLREKILECFYVDGELSCSGSRLINKIWKAKRKMRKDSGRTRTDTDVLINN